MVKFWSSGCQIRVTLTSDEEISRSSKRLLPGTYVFISVAMLCILSHVSARFIAELSRRSTLPRKLHLGPLVSNGSTGCALV